MELHQNSTIPEILSMGLLFIFLCIGGAIIFNPEFFGDWVFVWVLAFPLIARFGNWAWNLRHGR